MEIKGLKLATSVGARAALERTALVVLVALGWWHGIEGARNVAAALVAVRLLLVVLVCSTESVPARWASEPPLPRCWLGRITWYVLPVLVVLLVWHGAFVLAAMLALLMLLSKFMRDKVERLRGELGEDAGNIAEEVGAA